MACASSTQKKGCFVIVLFVLSLKQTMTIKEGIYVPTTLTQELYTRPWAMLLSDGGDYLVVIPNSLKRNIKKEGLLINAYKVLIPKYWEGQKRVVYCKYLQC